MLRSMHTESCRIRERISCLLDEAENKRKEAITKVGRRVRYRYLGAKVRAVPPHAVYLQTVPRQR